MVKSTLILINIIGLALLNLFFLQRIEIAHSPPEVITPGQSAEVEVVISKGSVGGFAKFQLNADPGLTIEPIENSGASFTFHDQKAKFIWMSLPEEKTIVLRYRISMGANAQGIKKIEGHFSYIDDNQRLVFDIETKTIAPSADAVVESIEKTSSNQRADASVIRKITESNNGRYLVELDIQKHGLTGFAKVQETISRDYTAVAVKSAEAVFNLVDDKVKFVWFDIPDHEIITVSYELIPVANDVLDPLNIEGDFSFLVNGETRAVRINSESDELTSQSLSQAEDPAMEMATDEPVEEIEEDAPPTEPTQEDVAVVEVEEVTPWESVEIDDSESEKSTEIEDPFTKETIHPAQDMMESEKVVADQTPQQKMKEEAPAQADAVTTVQGIFYRVQITAAHKVVDAQYFKTQHQFQGPFFIEHHQGWIKYTTGNFDAYNSARDHRDKLNNGHDFPGPFVTAYNDTERISVQEALMISNQKWVP